LEDGGSQHRIDTAVVETGVEMFERAATAVRNERHAYRVGDRTQQLVVVTTLGSVTVDAGNQQFTGALMNDGPRPLDRIEPGRLAPTVREHFPAHGFLLLVDAFGVDRDDDALHAVARAGFADKIRLNDRSGIDAAFCGTGHQKRADSSDERWRGQRG